MMIYDDLWWSMGFDRKPWLHVVRWRIIAEWFLSTLPYPPYPTHCQPSRSLLQAAGTHAAQSAKKEETQQARTAGDSAASHLDTWNRLLRCWWKIYESSVQQNTTTALKSVSRGNLYSKVWLLPHQNQNQVEVQKRHAISKISWILGWSADHQGSPVPLVDGTAQQFQGLCDSVMAFQLRAGKNGYSMLSRSCLTARSLDLRAS